MSGRKLGKQMIEEFAVMFGGLAAAVKPVGTGPDGQVTRPDIDKSLGTKYEREMPEVRSFVTEI